MIVATSATSEAVLVASLLGILALAASTTFSSTSTNKRYPKAFSSISNTTVILLLLSTSIWLLFCCFCFIYHKMKWRCGLSCWHVGISMSGKKIQNVGSKLPDKNATRWQFGSIYVDFISEILQYKEESNCF